MTKSGIFSRKSGHFGMFQVSWPHQNTAWETDMTKFEMLKEEAALPNHSLGNRGNKVVLPKYGTRDKSD